MDSTGLGTAIGEYQKEQMIQRALKETEELRARVRALEFTVLRMETALLAHGFIHERPK